MQVAQQRLAELAKRREVLDVGIVGNPALQKGDLVSVDDPLVGITVYGRIDTLETDMTADSSRTSASPRSSRRTSSSTTSSPTPATRSTTAGSTRTGRPTRATRGPTTDERPRRSRPVPQQGKGTTGGGTVDRRQRDHHDATVHKLDGPEHTDGRRHDDAGRDDDEHGLLPKLSGDEAAAEATAAAALAAHVASSASTGGEHVHVAGETHLSDGSTTTYTLDEAFEPGSVEAWNTTTLAYLTVTETQPDQATVSAAGSSGDKITFSYAASLA
jgi:hypothetical protein